MNGTVFKFNRDTHAVRIEKIAGCVGKLEIIEVFSNLIGQVRKCEESVNEEDERYIDITFFTRDASRKALCMSGYTIAGVSLSVSALAPPPNPRIPPHPRHVDDRRNLYVLGLPFNLTKTEFTEIFARYGNVNHSVILATVDNASRRRGFVVMASHAEAKCAMDGLSRSEIKGHVIDVSWAVVQRSQGFLDGGDRTLVNSPRATPSPSPVPGSAQPSERGAPTPPLPHPKSPTDALIAEHHLSRLTTIEPTPTLLVTNLSALLFSTAADLRPLFCPFGDIKRLEVLRAGAGSVPGSGSGATPPTSASGPAPSSSPTPPSAGPPPAQGIASSLSPAPTAATTPAAEEPRMSVVVEYSGVDGAREAKESLHGQMYGALRVCVDFVEAPSSPGPSPPQVQQSQSQQAQSLSLAPLSLSGNQGPHYGQAYTQSPTDEQPFAHGFNYVQNQNQNPNQGPGQQGMGLGMGHLKRPSTAGAHFGGGGGGGGAPFMFEVIPSSPPPASASAIKTTFGAGPGQQRSYTGHGAYGGGYGGYGNGNGGFGTGHGGGNAYGTGTGNGFSNTLGNANSSGGAGYGYGQERRAMYDRSNNTSPFPGRIGGSSGGSSAGGMLTPSLSLGHVSSQGLGAGLGGGTGMGGGLGAGGIAATLLRPSSSDGRLPGGGGVPPPPPPASAGPWKIRFGAAEGAENRFDEDSAGSSLAFGRGRMFRSMPDVFDFASDSAYA